MNVMLSTRLSPAPQNGPPRQILQQESPGPVGNMAEQYRQGPRAKSRILIERPEQRQKCGIHVACGV